MGLWATAFATALTFHLIGNYQHGRYDNNKPQGVRFGDLAEQNYLRRDVALYVGIGLWALNLLDAYLDGPPNVGEVEASAGWSF